MTIDHVAVWVNDLEKMKDFYIKYFGCKTNEKYCNPKNRFESYFLAFKSGARLELMLKPEIPDNLNNVEAQYRGIIHIAIRTGSDGAVDELTRRIKSDGFTVVSEPRMTGDGFYESCILDPENNRIEIVS